MDEKLPKPLKGQIWKLNGSGLWEITGDARWVENGFFSEWEVRGKDITTGENETLYFNKFHFSQGIWKLDTNWLLKQEFQKDLEDIINE